MEAARAEVLGLPGVRAGGSSASREAASREAAEPLGRSRARRLWAAAAGEQGCGAPSAAPSSDMGAPDDDVTHGGGEAAGCGEAAGTSAACDEGGTGVSRHKGLIS